MTSTFDEWVASLDGGESPDAMVFLQQVFDDHGPVSHEDLQRIAHTNQLALARVAVGWLGQDVAATTDLEPPSFGYRDEDGSVPALALGHLRNLTSRRADPGSGHGRSS